MWEKARSDSYQHIDRADCAGQVNKAGISSAPMLLMDPETRLMKTTFQFRIPIFEDYNTT